MYLLGTSNMSLFDPICPVGHVAAFLDANHYLGRATRGFAWSDEYGVIVLANPAARWLPQDWLELSRWCLIGIPNGGSQQWARIVRWLKTERPEVTTVISYSDPSIGHTGALYKACNWIAAPTWQRLRPPPSGHGRWSSDGPIQTPKDRWVYPLHPDVRRARSLRINDAALVKRFGDLEYREPRKFQRAAGVEETTLANQPGSLGAMPSRRSLQVGAGPIELTKGAG